MSALTPQDKDRATAITSVIDTDFDSNPVLSALRATFDTVNQRADPHRVAVPTWATQQAARDRAKQVLRARLNGIFPRESTLAAGDPFSRDVKIATKISVKGVPPAKGEKAPAVPEVFRLEVVPTTPEADKILRDSHVAHIQKGAAEAVKQKVNGAEAATGAKRQDGAVAVHFQVALDKEKVKKNTAAVRTLLAGAGAQQGFLTAAANGDVVVELEGAEATGASSVSKAVGSVVSPIVKATPFAKKTPSEIATLVVSYLKVRVASTANRATFAQSQSWVDLAANGAVDFELALRRDAIVAAMGESIADAAAKGGAFCTPAVQKDLATLLSMDSLRAVNLEVELAPLPYTFVDMVRGLSVQTRYQRLAPAPGKEVDLAKAAITDGCGPEQFIATSISRLLRLGNGGSDVAAAIALNMLRPKSAPAAAAVRAAGELGGHLKALHLYTGDLKAKISMDWNLDGLISDDVVAMTRGAAAAYLAATKGATIETLPPFGEVYQALALKHSLEIEQCFGKGVDTKAVRSKLPAAYDGALYQRMHPMDAVCCVLVLNLDPTPVHALRLLGGFNVTSHMDERCDAVYQQLADGKPLAGVFSTTTSDADKAELARMQKLPFWGLAPGAAKTSTPFVTVGPLAGSDPKDKPADREKHRALKFVVADSAPRVSDIAGALAVADAIIVVQGGAATADAAAAINNGTHPTLKAVQEAYKATPQVGAKVAAETPILYVTTRARAAADAKLPVPSLLPTTAKPDSKVNTLVVPIEGRRATAAQGAQIRRWIEQAAGAADACGEGAGTWDWLPADYPIVDRLNLRHFV